MPSWPPTPSIALSGRECFKPSYSLICEFKISQSFENSEYFYTLILAAKPALRLFIDLVDPKVNSRTSSHTFGY